MTNPVLRDTPERVIQGFDSQLCPFAIPFGSLLHQKFEHVCQHGIVDLKQKPCIVYPLIFRTQGFCQSENVVPLGRIIFVHTCKGSGLPVATAVRNASVTETESRACLSSRMFVSMGIGSVYAIGPVQASTGRPSAIKGISLTKN